MKSVQQDQLDARAFFAKVWSDGAPCVPPMEKQLIEVICIRMFLAGVKSGIEQMEDTHKVRRNWKALE